MSVPLVGRRPAGAPSRPPAGTSAPAVRAGGAAVLVAAGYLDPGNWGADVAAGAAHGTSLAWVLAVAVVAAFVVQALAARVGAATGADLTTLVRTACPAWVSVAVRPVFIGAVVLTDVVEVFGVVLGVHLVTGWSAGASGLAAGALVLAAVAVPAGVGRALVYGTVGVVSAVYLVAAAHSGALPTPDDLRPHLLPVAAAPLALGLVGSVVMPHNVLLHSALGRDAGPARLRRGTWALGAALVVALGVNLVVLTTAAQEGGSGEIADGVRLVAPVVLGATLVAVGLASSVTTGMVGADVSRDLLPGRAGTPLVRRFGGLLPAVVVLMAPVDGVGVLAWSQVALAVCLPAVLLPLVWLAGRPAVMGAYLPGRATLLTARAVVGAISAAAVAVPFLGA